MKQNLIEVAVVGKSVGLRGEQKLHLLSDFPKQFKKGSFFYTSDGEKVEIESFNPKRSLVKFLSCNSVEDTKKYINQKLYTTVEETRKNCSLKEGEFFWFDIIGSSLQEGGVELGRVEEIDRIAANDYLVVKTNPNLNEKFSKRFYLPYTDHFIDRFDPDTKIIYTKHAYDILENS